MRKNSIFFFLLLLGSISLQAQKIRDFQTRANFEISADLTSDMEGSLEFGQRMKNNSLVYDRSLVTAALMYDLPAGFSVGAGARYLLVSNAEHMLESRYRFHSDVRYRYRIDRLQIRIRDRLQYGFDDISSIADFGNKLTNRTRLGLKYDIFGFPIAVYGSIEVYMLLNDPTRSVFALNKYRAGITWDLPGKLDLDLYYLMEDELNQSYPTQAHIAVVSLELKL